MVGLEILISMERGKRNEFLQAFESLTRPQEGEVACLDQALFEQVGWGSHMLWTERWKTRALLERRMESERFRTLLAAADVLGTVEDLRLTEYGPPVPGGLSSTPTES